MSELKEKLLQLISAKPGQTSFELARQVGQDVATVVAALKQLAEEGEIVRRPGRRGKLNHCYPLEPVEI